MFKKIRLLACLIFAIVLMASVASAREVVQLKEVNPNELRAAGSQVVMLVRQPQAGVICNADLTFVGFVNGDQSHAYSAELPAGKDQVMFNLPGKEFSIVSIMCDNAGYVLSNSGGIATIYSQPSGSQYTIVQIAKGQNTAYNNKYTFTIVADSPGAQSNTKINQ